MSECVHRWLITGSPPVQRGECRKCGATRAFTPILLGRHGRYGDGAVQKKRVDLVFGKRGWWSHG